MAGILSNEQRKSITMLIRSKTTIISRAISATSVLACFENIEGYSRLTQSGEIVTSAFDDETGRIYLIATSFDIDSESFGKERKIESDEEIADMLILISSEVWKEKFANNSFKLR